VQRSLCCPFHPDKRPSCRIEIDRKLFHCFACEAAGNVLEFVARMEGDADDLRAAAVKLADICGIATAPPRGEAAKPRQGPAERRKRAKQGTNPSPWSKAALPPRQRLWRGR
jgi:DNA primase